MTFDVLDQGCVHARLPARPTGSKELHDLSIQAVPGIAFFRSRKIDFKLY